METLLLRDEKILPAPEVLEETLGGNFTVFSKLMDALAHPDIKLVPEWNFYKDGKAWLCKVVHKKKTIFWLSVWDNCFKVAFYFTEKNFDGIENLDIDNALKQDFFRAKPIGKLIPLLIRVNREEQLNDILKIIHFKKTLK